MKKLAKKQMGGAPKKPKSFQIPSFKKERTGDQAEMMKPYGKQEKFDSSKVSTSGAKIKGAAKIGSGTYQPDSTRYKKMGGCADCAKKKKMAKGGATSFGMLSVKAGIDKNPKATFADKIAGAKKSTNGKKLVKAQKGKTVFQAYLNKYNANPSDTLVKSDPRGITKFGWGDKSQNNALAAAFQKTYGDTHGHSLVGEGSDAERAARIAQSKKTVKRYTKDLNTPQNFRWADNYDYKKGGAVKSKSKKKKK